jgi:hypothetical protein
VHEGLGEAFCLMQAQKQQAAEHLHDSRGIQRRKRQKLAFGREHAVENQGMGVRVEVGPIGAMGLQRDDTAGADIGAVKQRLEGFQDRGIGRLRQQAQQLAVALDEAAQDARDRKRPVPVGHGSENFRGEFFGKEHGALGLATGAEIPRAA